MEKVTDIMDRCRRQERTAQMALYTRFAPELYAACLRIVGNTQEAEETMHDAMLKAFGALASSATLPEAPERWMRKIAVRSAIDHVRLRRVTFESLDESSVAETAPGPDDDESCGTALTVEAVRQAMALLPDGYRVVISLYLFEGYDFDEIASILDVKQSTVRSQYSRGRGRLIELLKK